jgi:hypothetical protein
MGEKLRPNIEFAKLFLLTNRMRGWFRMSIGALQKLAVDPGAAVVTTGV